MNFVCSDRLMCTNKRLTKMKRTQTERQHTLVKSTETTVPSKLRAAQLRTADRVSVHRKSVMRTKKKKGSLN